MHLNGTQWVARFRLGAFPLDNSSARRSTLRGDGGLTTALLKARVDWHGQPRPRRSKVTLAEKPVRLSNVSRQSRLQFLAVHRRQQLLLGYFWVHATCVYFGSVYKKPTPQQAKRGSAQRAAGDVQPQPAVFTLDTTWRCCLPPLLKACNCLPSVVVERKQGVREGRGRCASFVACFLPLLRWQWQPLYALHVAKLHLQGNFLFSDFFCFCCCRFTCFACAAFIFHFPLFALSLSRNTTKSC